MKHFSIIVTYEPKGNGLELLCDSLVNQSSTIVIVDNSEKNPLNYLSIENCTVLRIGKNIGIAAAQNIGISYAENEGADLISFFDQDSDVEYGFLEKVLEPFQVNSSCVTAPLPINKQTGEEYPSQVINRIGWPKDVYSRKFKTPYEVDLVISSGLTVSVEVLHRIGNFDEDFFIDFVDIEWCLRCKKARIPIFILPTAKMGHSIGDDSILVGRLDCLLHSPQRTYYKVRNSFLIFRKGAPLIFSIRQCVSALIKNFLLLSKANDFSEYLRYYSLGIRDGILGKRGKGSS